MARERRVGGEGMGVGAAMGVVGVDVDAGIGVPVRGAMIDRVGWG